MLPFEPRLLTGPSQIVIGVVFLLLGLRLWLVHPVNRVFRLGPFVTERGLKAVMGLRLLLSNLGLFFATQGAASVRYWFAAGRDVQDPTVVLLGSMSAVFAVTAATLLCVATWRLWRVR